MVVSTLPHLLLIMQAVHPLSFGSHRGIVSEGRAQKLDGDGDGEGREAGEGESVGQATSTSLPVLSLRHVQVPEKHKTQLFIYA